MTTGTRRIRGEGNRCYGGRGAGTISPAARGCKHGKDADVHCGTVPVIPDAKRAGDGACPGEGLVGGATSGPILRRRGGAAAFVVRQAVVGAGDKVGEKSATGATESHGHDQRGCGSARQRAHRADLQQQHATHPPIPRTGVPPSEKKAMGHGRARGS